MARKYCLKDIKIRINNLKKILGDDKLRARFSKKSLEIAKEHDFETTLDKFTNIYKKVTSR